MILSGALQLKRLQKRSLKEFRYDGFEDFESCKKLNISRFFPAVTKFVTYLKCSSPVRIVSMLETCTCVTTDNLHVDSSWKSKTSTFYKHTSAIFFFTFKSSTSFMSSIDSSTLPSAPTKMNTQSFKIISCPMTCKENQQTSLNP